MKVDAAGFSDTFLAIALLFYIQLDQRPAPQELDKSGRFLRRRVRPNLYFRVTLGFSGNSNFKFLRVDGRGRCPAAQRVHSLA